LLDIAKGVAGLSFHPRPKPRLQRSIIQLERTRRQRRAPTDGHDLRLAVGDSRQHRDEINRQAGRRRA
jgi:hypothetical protein